MSLCPSVRPFLAASLSGPSLRPITHCVVRTIQTLDNFARPMTVLAERHIFLERFFETAVLRLFGIRT